MTTRTNNKPTHKLYAITKSANTDKGFWQEIGAAWEHRDGDGFNVKLLLLPLVGQDIVIRKVKADTAAQPSENADQLHDEMPY
jgi:hypothetical protein